MNNQNTKKLVEWCWTHLVFENCPENWEDTFIIDILTGYDGNCYTHDGKAYTYSQIRTMFL